MKCIEHFDPTACVCNSAWGYWHFGFIDFCCLQSSILSHSNLRKDNNFNNKTSRTFCNCSKIFITKWLNFNSTLFTFFGRHSISSGFLTASFRKITSYHTHCRCYNISRYPTSLNSYFQFKNNARESLKRICFTLFNISEL